MRSSTKLLLLSVAALSLTTGSVNSQESSDQSKFSRPDPHLRQIHQSQEDKRIGAATWTGHVVLTGALVVEFDRPSDGTPPTYPPTDAKDSATKMFDGGYAFFLPDEKSRSKLPAAIGKYVPGPVDVISLLIKRPARCKPFA
jgi:hypothetical protein